MGASESVPFLGPPYVKISEIQKAKVEVEKAFKDTYGNIFLNNLPEAVDYYAMYCAKERRKGMFRNEQMCAERVPEIFEEYYSTERDKWNSATEDEKEDIKDNFQEVYETSPPVDYLPSIQKVFEESVTSDIFAVLAILSFLLAIIFFVPILILKVSKNTKSKEQSIIPSFNKKQLFETSLGCCIPLLIACMIFIALMIYYRSSMWVLDFYNDVFGKMRAESGEKNNTFR